MNNQLKITMVNMPFIMLDTNTVYPLLWQLFKTRSQLENKKIYRMLIYTTIIF